MPQTRRARKSDKDLISRLADAGEDVLHRLEDLPGGKAMVEAATGLRKRLDELAVRLRALDPLEKRVAALEKRLEALERRSRSEKGQRATPDG
jgi:hypothetical protein